MDRCCQLLKIRHDSHKLWYLEIRGMEEAGGGGAGMAQWQDHLSPSLDPISVLGTRIVEGTNSHKLAWLPYAPIHLHINRRNFKESLQH